MSESTIKIDTISSYDSMSVNLSTGDITRIQISGNTITASLPVEINGLVSVGENCTVLNGQFATCPNQPDSAILLCNKTYVDGKKKVKAIITPAGSQSGFNTFPATFTFPVNTFLIHGHAYHAMTSNNGTRLDAQFFNGTTPIGSRFAISGGNELPNGDGGRGMTCRWNFVIGVPETATSVKFTRGEGSSQGGVTSGGTGFMQVLINQTVVIS